MIEERTSRIANHTRGLLPWRYSEVDTTPLNERRPEHATAVPLVPAGAVCCHFQLIAYIGACGKAPVMPQTGSDGP
jgi:hypothetical protein